MEDMSFDMFVQEEPTLAVVDTVFILCPIQTNGFGSGATAFLMAKPCMLGNLKFYCFNINSSRFCSFFESKGIRIFD